MTIMETLCQELGPVSELLSNKISCLRKSYLVAYPFCQKNVLAGVFLLSWQQKSIALESDPNSLNFWMAWHLQSTMYV